VADGLASCAPAERAWPQARCEVRGGGRGGSGALGAFFLPVLLELLLAVLLGHHALRGLLGSLPSLCHRVSPPRSGAARFGTGPGPPGMSPRFARWSRTVCLTIRRARPTSCRRLAHCDSGGCGSGFSRDAVACRAPRVPRVAAEAAPTTPCVTVGSAAAGGRCRPRRCRRAPSPRHR